MTARRAASRGCTARATAMSESEGGTDLMVARTAEGSIGGRGTESPGARLRKAFTAASAVVCSLSTENWSDLGRPRDPRTRAEAARPGNLLAQLHVRLGEVAPVELEVWQQQVHDAHRQHRVGQRTSGPDAERRSSDGCLPLRYRRVARERFSDQRL